MFKRFSCMLLLLFMLSMFPTFSFGVENEESNLDVNVVITPQIDYNDKIWVTSVPYPWYGSFSNIPYEKTHYIISDGWIYRGVIYLYYYHHSNSTMWMGFYQGYLYNTGHMTG